MKKQNIAIIAVVAFVLAISVGYALFSETLQINGTATAKGNFDVQFTSATQGDSKGYTKQKEPEHELAKIEDGGKTLTITVNKLDYPGAYVNIPITVTNQGTISAVLKSVEQTSAEEIQDPIKITYTGLTENQGEEKTIASGATHTFNVKVEWDPEDNDKSNKRDVTTQFKVTLNYEQAVNQN